MDTLPIIAALIMIHGGIIGKSKGIRSVTDRAVGRVTIQPTDKEKDVLCICTTTDPEPVCKVKTNDLKDGILVETFESAETRPGPYFRPEDHGSVYVDTGFYLLCYGKKEDSNDF